MTGTLLKINGVWVTDPDPDSWSPVNCYEWTAGSGRVNTTGLFVGARKFCKYKLPCKWTMLPVADSAEIQSLIEDGPDFAELEFWHNGKYYSISANASDYVPQGLSDLTVVSITRAVLSHSQNVRRAYVHHSKQ